MVTLPAANWISDNARTQGERKQFLEDILAFLTERFGVDSGIAASSRNAFINPRFGICQRFGPQANTVTDIADVYTVDRWRTILEGAGGSVTVRRIEGLEGWAGDVGIPNEPRYYLSCQQTAAPATRTRITEQVIEGVRSFAGQTITVSFWAKADAAQQFAVDVTQYFGSGGFASPDVSLSQNFSITASWTLYELQFAVASISGKDIGQNGDDGLRIGIVTTTGSNSTFTLEIAEAQVEPGSGRTPFEVRPLTQEWNFVQRYLFQTYDRRGDLSPTGAVTYYTQNAGLIPNGVWVRFPVRMRRAPTIKTSRTNAFASDANWYNHFQLQQSGAAVVEHLSDQGFFIQNPQIASDLIGGRCSIHVEAESEI